MTKISIVLTGIEESRSYIRVSRLEDALSGKSSDFRVGGPAVRYLVFNDGALKIPCDQETFKKIVDLWNNSIPKGPNVKQSKERSSIEGVEMFGGDIPPIPDEEDDEEYIPDESDWSGAEDEGEDGVGQV